MKLLPCPFCGGEAVVTQYGNYRQSTIYECNECGCRLETGEVNNFGTRWNKRTYTEELEALHKIINAYGEHEGWTPNEVVEEYNKYHRPWEKEKHPEYFDE